MKRWPRIAYVFEVHGIRIPMDFVVWLAHVSPPPPFAWDGH